MDAPRLIVEVRDPKALLVRLLLGKASGEEVAGGGDAGEFERDFGTLTTHPTQLAELACGDDEKRIRIGSNRSILEEPAIAGWPRPLIRHSFFAMPRQTPRRWPARDRFHAVE